MRNIEQSSTESLLFCFKSIFSVVIVLNSSRHPNSYTEKKVFTSPRFTFVGSVGISRLFPGDFGGKSRMTSFENRLCSLFVDPEKVGRTD